jgi:type IX secretion system PorP/SprF family membrane protein
MCYICAYKNPDAMKYFRKTFYCFLFLFVFFNSSVKAQYVYNFSSSNFLQYNPAYAGQDTNHCFFLGGDFSSEWLNGAEGAPYAIQFSYAGNFKKFKSGLAATSSISSFGLETRSNVGTIYNFNFVINENSNLRVGLGWTQRVFHIDLSSMIFNDGGDMNFELPETTHSFNFDAGLWYANKKLNVGFSVQNILDKKGNVLMNAMYQRTTNAIISYEFAIAEPVKIKPTVIFQNFRNEFGSYSMCLISNSFIFDDTFIFGFGYSIVQYGGPLYLEAGAKAGKHVQLMLGYSNRLNKHAYSNENVSAMIKVNLY